MFFKVMFETLFSQKERFFIRKNRRLVLGNNESQEESSLSEADRQTDVKKIKVCTERERWLFTEAFK